MAWGDKLERGRTGKDVIELQLRLSGFRGTLWDGKFGPGTELQVVSFQRDFMRQKSPTGRVDTKTFDGLEQLASDYPLDWTALACPCGQCGGFGQGRFEGEYAAGKPRVEAYHRREYPGIHKAILHAFRAVRHYASLYDFPEPTVTSGYRCWIENERKGRSSTNHMGKAIDFDFPVAPGEDGRDDQNRCNQMRGLLGEKGNFHENWDVANRKALEPASLAPTWVHMDVRSYSQAGLAAKFFARDAAELDGGS
jgi:hypothetical protein